MDVLGGRRIKREKDRDGHLDAQAVSPVAICGFVVKESECLPKEAVSNSGRE